MARRDGSFRTDWNAERNNPKRSDFHHEQQVFRKHGGEDAEHEDDWLLNAPGKEDEEEAETV
jgi:hypothetical protein